MQSKYSKQTTLEHRQKTVINTAIMIADSILLLNGGHLGRHLEFFIFLITTPFHLNILCGLALKRP